ncbi:hypothetical protein WSM22_31560 [Cytophagales bacterium WSM2-2]|nr:hypothetical protein WSM22_31560 [Cytophagales bacterium WSM2-2]
MKVKLISCLSVGLVVALGALVSCSKKNETPIPSKESLLVLNNGWRLTSVTISPGIGGVTDYYNTVLEACERDNIMLFDPHGTYTVDEGATKCDPSDPQTADHGTWTFNASKTVITQISADVSALPVALNIVSLSATTLVYKSSINFLGTDYTLTVTQTAIQ